MISIALRNLFGEKTRLLISIGGVAFSVMLILIILSLYRGWQIKATQYMREIDTDLWVTQDGAVDITSSASIIYPEVAEQIRSLDGVAEAHQFLGRPVQFSIKNRDVNAYIVGFDPDDPVTGPQHMSEGTDKPKVGEIVIDRVLARNNNLVLGDLIEIFDKTYKIVGIAEGANMFLFQFSFLNVSDAREIFNNDEFFTYYLIKAEQGKRDQVVQEIDEIEGISVFTSGEFVDKNKRFIDEVFLPIITVLVVISMFVGTAVIGLTIYTATIEKSREFGVLKALGASNLQVYRIIFEQAMVSGVIGYVLGVGLTYFLLWLIPQYAATFVTVTLTTDLVWVFTVALIMSILASYTPVRRIVKIDPALVFKS